MSAVPTLTAGFLPAVLWFDLFDVQVLGRRPVGEPLAEQVLASIAAYYRHGGFWRREKPGGPPRTGTAGGMESGPEGPMVSR